MREQLRFVCQILSGVAGVLAIARFIIDYQNKGGSLMLWGISGLLLIGIFVWLSWGPAQKSIRARRALKARCQYFISKYKKLQADCGPAHMKMPRAGSSWPELSGTHEWQFVHLMLFTLDRELTQFEELVQELERRSLGRGDGSFVDLIHGLETLRQEL